MRYRTQKTLKISYPLVEKAVQIGPEISTLVPERREEVTTEGGLEVAGNLKRIGEATKTLQAAGIIVSLFIDPDPAQVKATAQVGAEQVEFHTGKYCLVRTEVQRLAELRKLYDAARQAQELGLVVNAGHGLNYHNTAPVAAIPGMRELNIGHSIISRAIFDGLHKAVADMADLIDRVTRQPQAYRPEGF